MFAVLDTNHFRELAENSGIAQRLKRRLGEQDAEVFTCIVAVEETIQGWLALLHRQRPGRTQLATYARLQLGLESLLKLPILPLDADAAEVFHRLQTERIRIGTMDLKIAAICIAHHATLLTRNLVDFEKVPGLRVENWLD